MAEAAAVTLLLARCAAGFVLVLAGLAKIRMSQDRFLAAVLGYQLLSGFAAMLVARTLPWIEVLTGALLVVGLFTPVAAPVAFLLFFVFSLAILHSLLRGVSNQCGCFRDPVPVQWRLVYRNVVLMGLALAVVLMGGGPLSMDSAIGHAAALGVGQLSVPSGALVTVWVGAASSVLVLRQLWSRRNEERTQE